MSQDSQVHKSQQALDQVQDELTKLITENQQLKSQLQETRRFKGKVNRLEGIIFVHRLLTKSIAELTSKHHGDKSHVPDFFVNDQFALARGNRYEDEKKWLDQLVGVRPKIRTFTGPNKLFANIRDVSARLDRENRQLKSEVADLQGKKRWLNVQMQADKAITCTKLASMGLKERKKKLKKKDHMLASSAREMQASTEMSNLTIADLNRTIKGLEEQMQESEKHCHQVINHLGNLIELHAGESFDMRGINGACDNVNNAEVVEKTVKWLGWNEKDSRAVRDMGQVIKRSERSRTNDAQNSIEHTTNEHEADTASTVSVPHSTTSTPGVVQIDAPPNTVSPISNARKDDDHSGSNDKVSDESEQNFEPLELSLDHFSNMPFPPMGTCKQYHVQALMERPHFIPYSAVVHPSSCSPAGANHVGSSV
ncbi:hypothetical protein BU25DRAFT_445135 [Macroventuria anomochaeta]|uniref:Uncharacterized protein n=1 Tax=Macroventuria anomochaeta TaxID=301207 RepID=A0ACB6SD85_9PLEO|nr:uncharacterized protein BU25DRAFT_445135 [Macroventuria anomochaeta]KAF2631968.1 hypothetical protein BU25DRAFT_445135 [Macroventuria anomochaeta]